MDEFEQLFSSTVEELEKSQHIDTPAEKVIKEAEQEFLSYSEEEKSRRDEESTLQKKIMSLKTQLHKYKNIKNPRMRAANEKRAAKRKEITKNIELHKLRLQEIADERKGANTSSADLVKASGVDVSRQDISSWNNISSNVF